MPLPDKALPVFTSNEGDPMIRPAASALVIRTKGRTSEPKSMRPSGFPRRAYGVTASNGTRPRETTEKRKPTAMPQANAAAANHRALPEEAFLIAV